MKKSVFTFIILLCLGSMFIPFSNFYAQQISVNVDSYQQEFLGTGASCGLYLGHYLSMSEANRLEASRMLYEELKLNHIKNYQDDYPWTNPDKYDNVVIAINNAKIYCPDLKFMLCVHNLPNHLEKGGDTPDNVKGEHDPNIPGIMDSVANYYFHACKGYHDRGVTVDILEPENEVGYKTSVTNLFDIAVDKFRDMINDPSINTTNVPMPQIGGPATWSASSPKKFINGWKADRPNAWNNVDIVTSHGYQNGTESSYQGTYDVAEGKLFYQSEQTAKLQRDENPGVDVIAEQFPVDDPPGYVINAVIARHMMDFFNGGGNAFFHFLTNNPNGNNPALLGIKWNKAPIKGLPYHGFKHLSATHPLHSKKVNRNLTGMGNYKAVCFRNPGENAVYVHFVNLYNANEQVTINLPGYNITSLQYWKTDETNLFNEVVNETYSTHLSNLTVDATPYSVHTLKIGFVQSPVPTGVNDLSVSAVSNNQIDLIWTDRADNEQGFTIRRKVDGGTYSNIADVGPDVTSYTDNGLASNTLYYYQIRAFNASGYSPWSNRAGATTLNSNTWQDITENFESGTISGGTGWSDNWSLNSNASIHTKNQSDGYALRMVKNGQGTRTMDLSAGQNLQLTFDAKASSLDNNNEYGLVEIYDGSSWHEVYRLVNGEDNGVYRSITVDLSTFNFTGTSQQIRVRIVASGTKDYYRVNDIIISQNAAKSAPSQIIAQNNQANDIKLYPNPARNIFIIEAINTDIAKIQIFNMSGKMVYQNSLATDKLEIHTSELFKSGIYMVKINTASEVYFKKLLIK